MSFVVAYIIWYGPWTTAAKNIVLTFAKNVGTSPWWKINNPYGGVGALTFGGDIDEEISNYPL